MRKMFSLLTPALLMLAACNNYGEKVKKGHIEVYYKDGISKETAVQTANFLHDIDLQAQNDTTATKSMQLTKKQDTVVFRMVVSKEKMGGVTDENFIALANYLSTGVYGNAPVNVDLTNDRFEAFRSLRFQKMNPGE